MNEKQAILTAATMVADFYQALVDKKIPSDVAVRLTIGWLGSVMSSSQKEKSKALVDLLSNIQGGGN